MTVAEQPITFFVPRLDAAQPDDETAYAALVRCTTEDAGAPPRASRIHRLWCRRGGRDTVIEVGRADPDNGEVVLAIFDLGRQLPYVVHCGRPGDEENAVRDRVNRPVYAVTEFATA